MKDKKEPLEDFGKTELLNMINYLQTNLRRRTDQLHRARTTISAMKSRITKMKDTIENQRLRILELHPYPGGRRGHTAETVEHRGRTVAE
jgi:hypothetical protein